MKEYIGTDGIPVVEYELEDIPKLINGELPWIFGLVKTQRNSEGGESTWFRFTPEAEAVWNGNKAAQEKGYWAKVDKQLEAAKRIFLHELPKSPYPAETITDRIREGKWRLNPESDPNAVHDLWLFQPVHLGQAWHSLKRGNRNYVDYHHSQLQADIEHKFIKWLEELQEFPPMSKEGFAFEKVKAEVAIQNARDLVDYFTTGGVTVQLFKQGNKFFHEQTEQHLRALSELEQQTAFHPLHRDTLTLLQSSLPETLPTNLKALLQAKFETQGKPQGFFSLSKFAAHELKRLEQTPYWTNLAHHLPIAEDWKGYLKAVSLAKEQPEPVAQVNTPPQGSDGGTGAEIGLQPQGIIFTDPDTRKAIYEGLKGFFQDKETELLTLLEGGTVDKPLHFPDQQNRLAEVFSRAHHCQKIAGTKTDLQNWIAQNFTYYNKRTNTPTRCNTDTLRGIFSPKPESPEMPKPKRIEIEGLPYIPLSDRVDRG